MGPTHIVVISLPLPLNAITGYGRVPVVTLSPLSPSEPLPARQLFPVPAPVSFQRKKKKKNSWKEPLCNDDPTRLTTEGWKSN